MSMRWKKESSEKGVASVIQGPRGYWLREGDTRLASVRPLDRSGVAWYWVAGWDARDRIPHKNTCGEPTDSLESAKAQAVAYVRQNLAVQQPTQPEGE